jgi:GT2 family glycosyltransferase
MTPPADFPADVDVVVVAHNNLERLPATLDALLAAGCPASRITVVDVASTDGTAAWLAAHQPAVRIRPLVRNLGPNPGRNAGLREASSRFVLMMDPDVRVAADAVQRLHAAMAADPSVKIGSPIVVYGDRPDVIQYAGVRLHFICEAVNPWRGRTLAERGGEPQAIGAAASCALLIDRAAALEIGLFDERYFLGKDDGEFVHRMRIAGYTVLEVPHAVVFHDARERGIWLFYYQIRNRWHFMLKNYQLRTLVGLVPVLLVHEPLQCAMLVAKGHGLPYLKAMGGLIAMLPALPRDRAAVRRIRRARDTDLLVSGRLTVREDLAGGGLMRAGQRAYERALAAYWRLWRALGM